MLIAGRKANELGVPIVLDPVGAGATPFRTDSFLKLIEELDLAVVRGNSGEIGALSGAGGEVIGVDSVTGVADPAAVTSAAASSWSSVAAITAQRDVISDGERTVAVDNGHMWLTTLTGTGCMATSMIGCFAAVEEDYLVAAAGALACYGLAAERAAEEAKGPGTFKAALFDALYHLTPEDLESGAGIEVL
jgi:hydroxyethylthiazole kinase